MSDVVITETMEPEAVAELSARFDALYDPALGSERAGLLVALGTARGLVVRNMTRVDCELLDAAPGLRVVGRLGVGLDNIDVAECARRRIAVRPATGANAQSVAEYVIAAALMLRRGCFLATDAVAGGAWPRAALQGDEVASATLGLVGFGGTARAVAVRAAALGMEVIAHDPDVAPDDPAWRAHGVRPVALETLLSASDAVSLHVPLTDATRHLIDAAALSRMRSDAVLINTARGGVVDDAALAHALRAGRLGGAALDVFEAEPLPAGNPFAGLVNVVLTPHIAGLTRQSNRRVSRMVAHAVIAELTGNVT